MKLTDRIAKIARDEIIRPTLPDVREILERFEVVRHLGLPSIHKLKFKNDRTCFVYFPLHKRPYFLVTVIRVESGRPAVSHAFIESLTNVCMTVTSPTLSTRELTERIGIQSRHPLQLDRMASKPPNRWFYEPLPEAPGTLEEKLEFLLDSLMPAAGRIRELAEKGDACIYIHTVSLMSWSLGRDTLAKIAALGARVELAIDFYLPFPEFLLEKMAAG